MCKTIFLTSCSLICWIVFFQNFLVDEVVSDERPQLLPWLLLVKHVQFLYFLVKLLDNQSLLNNIVYFVCCTFDYAGSDFCYLINNVSSGVRKVVKIKKSSRLFSCPSMSNFSFSFLPSLCTVHGEILNFWVAPQRNQ